ncbi:hypothetical protein [Methylobacterium sp. GC_Met_2]|nr:hypothetical protein [Methylobacterium sp. GC_Met_2]
MIESALRRSGSRFGTTARSKTKTSEPLSIALRTVHDSDATIAE